MADKRISDLSIVTSISNNDVLPIVINTGGTPETRKATKEMLVGSAFNATSYGSGRTDVEIQLAIDDVPATGGVVYIPAGTWVISASLSVPSNVTVLGDGDSTILQFVAGTALKMFINSDTVGGNANISFEKFKIDGNVANRTGNADWGFYLDNITDLVFKDITCVDSRWTDIAVDNVTRCLVDNYNSSNPRACGFDPGAGCRFFKVTNSTVRGTNSVPGLFSHAFRINGEDFVVDNCIAYDCGDAGFGVGLGAWSNRAKRVSISNCIGYDTRDFPFFVGYGESISISNCIAQGRGDSVFKASSSGGGIGYQYVDGLSITDNVCIYNWYSGIMCSDQGAGQSATHLVIKGNICMNNEGQDTGTQAGILLYADGAASLTQSIIEGNICGDTQANPTQHWGIRLTSGTNNRHILKSNYCFGNSADGMSLAVADVAACIIEGNYCYNNGRETTGNGISLYAGSSCIINNNICYDDQTVATQLYGIYLVSIAGGNLYLTVTGNNCRGNKRHGIYIDTTARSTITGNVLFNNGRETANTYSGIYLDDCTYCSLVGNVSTGTGQKYGIESIATSNYLEIIGNTLSNNGTAATSLTGVNNDAAHNI